MALEYKASNYSVHFLKHVNLPSKSLLNNSRFGSNKRLSLYMIRSNILFILASFRQLVKKNYLSAMIAVC